MYPEPSNQSMNPVGVIILTLVGIAIIIAIFIIFRQVLLWYWKVNIIVKNQEEQTRLLKKLVGEKEQTPDLVYKLRGEEVPKKE